MDSKLVCDDGSIPSLEIISAASSVVESVTELSWESMESLIRAASGNDK